MKNLNTAKRIFLSPPYIGRTERLAVMKAFDSGYIAPCGPQVDEFERRIARLSSRKYAVALSSGTAAIDLILEYLGVGKGWTVVAPTLSFIATVGPAWHRGAKLVFIDSDATGNMDAKLLDTALKDIKCGKTLVIGVDLYGRCCDYSSIAKICRKHRVKFFVDAAESVGSKYRGKGSGHEGFAAVYSFNGNKTVTTSGGGAIVTDSKSLALTAKKLATQSREPTLHYEHKQVGYNYRMSNILAAIGLAQLDRLPEILRRRAAIAKFYSKRFPMLPTVKGENHWLNIMICDSESRRNSLIKRLAKANIEARPVWKPMHLQPVFRSCKVYGGEVAETMFRLGVCLPSGTGLSNADLNRIASTIG